MKAAFRGVFGLKRSPEKNGENSKPESKSGVRNNVRERAKPIVIVVTLVNGEKPLSSEENQSKLSQPIKMTRKYENGPAEQGNSRSDNSSKPLYSSSTHQSQGKRRRFRSSTAIPLTSEELRALELDINKPLNIYGLIQSKVTNQLMFLIT